MCLIIDASVAPRVFSSNEDADFQPVRDSLFQTHGLKAKLVYGGKLLVECQKIGDAVRLLAVLDRAGRAEFIDNERVNDEEEQIKSLGICKSNDPHVLALARVSHVRLLCTYDKDLIVDFTNKDLVDEPRGKVYQKASHRHLIAEFCHSW